MSWRQNYLEVLLKYRLLDPYPRGSDSGLQLNICICVQTVLMPLAQKPHLENCWSRDRLKVFPTTGFIYSIWRKKKKKKKTPHLLRRVEF